MPYLRQTLIALRAQAMQDITASPLPGADGLLTKAVLRVMALVQAGFAFLHYDFLDWISKQATPWGATDEYAAGWGSLIGVNQLDATTAGAAPAAPGAVTFANNVVGTVLPAGTALARLDGTLFVSTADATVDGSGNLAVPTAATLAGSASNTPTGSVMRLQSPANGINSSTGICTGAIVGGSDQEDPTAFKTRYLAQYASPPQGGDRSDYIEWATAVPGVTRAWVIPNGNGPGTAVVFTMFDVAEAGAGGFPVGSNGVATAEPRDVAAAGDQLTVANSILPLQPVTALVYSFAPVASPQPFTIANLLPNTTIIQAAIQAALADMFLRIGQVGGTVNPVTGAAWGTIYQSDWDAAIEAVPGIVHFTVASPAAPITPATGSLFTLGATAFSP